MFKFLHAADIHLDSPLRGLNRYEGAPAEEIRGATRRALEQLVETAIEHEVDFVVIAGDLYDGDWKDHNTGLFFAAQVRKLREANIPIYLITGNHDATNKMTKSLDLAANPDGTPRMLSHTKPQTVRLDNLGVAIHGLSFASAAVAENVVGGFPSAEAGWFNLGLLHTSLDSESNDEHARYAPCKIADLENKEYQYWALGHIHKRAVRHEQPHVVFPGNIQGRHIKEAGPKGCVIVTVDDRHHVKTEFIPLDVFRWEICRIPGKDVDGGEGLLDRFRTRLTELVEQNAPRPLAVRVLVEGPCAAHQQLAENPLQWNNQIRAAALDTSGGAVWVEKVKLRTTPLKTHDEASLQDGPVGELLQYMQELRRDEYGSNKAQGNGSGAARSDVTAADPTGLEELSKALDDLRQKLPDELTSGLEPLDLASPARIRQMLEEVEPFLLGRLLAHDE